MFLLEYANDLVSEIHLLPRNITNFTVSITTFSTIYLNNEMTRHQVVAQQ